MYQLAEHFGNSDDNFVLRSLCRRIRIKWKLGSCIGGGGAETNVGKGLLQYDKAGHGKVVTRHQVTRQLVKKAFKKIVRVLG